jgi:hypothetical protein
VNPNVLTKDESTSRLGQGCTAHAALVEVVDRLMTNLIIKVLTLTALAASVYFFIDEIKRGRRAEKLVQWVKTNHPAHWGALPWAARNISSFGGLTLLHKQRVISDPHFVAEFKNVRQFRKNQIIAFIVGVGAIALIPIGVTYWGWEW